METFVSDGSADFTGGQDASKTPGLVAPNAYFSGVNVSTKNGALSPRWGFEKLDVTYPEGGFYDRFRNFVTYATLFQSGKFQAIMPYSIGSEKYLIIVVSGFIFYLNLRTYIMEIHPIEDGTLINPRAPRINWSPAGKYLVLFDFPAFPVIIDGFEVRRADPAANEIPVSTLGAYNQNRLYIANAGNEFTGGDPAGTPFSPNAPITFDEIYTIGSPYFGQILKLPTDHNNEPITAMGFLQVSDTSTGIGPLLVATSKAIYTFQTNTPRYNWDTGQFGSNLLYNAGIVGPRAIVNVNSDAFFMALDGHVRTLSMSRAEQQRWSRVPISREVDNWLICNDRDLLQYAFAGYFNNKVFFSVNPYRVPAIDYLSRLPISDYAHGGLIVLELDNVTSFGQAARPAWAGLWTGIRPMDLAVSDERCFIMSKDSSQINRLFEVNPEINYDTADGKIRYVKSRVYTKDFDFKDPFTNKEMHTLDANFDSLTGDFKFKVMYRPGHSPMFLPWREFALAAPWRTCCMPGDAFLNGFSPYFIRDFTIGSPDGECCNPVTNEYMKVFRTAQLMLDLEGIYWELHDLRINAIVRPQQQLENLCQNMCTIPLPTWCTNDWLLEEFGSCLQQMT